jgi:hypothetical protein
MRELGRRGGKSKGRVKPEHVPQSLREELQTLDSAIAKAAIEEALVGSNQSAKVAAVKLFADLDVYGGKDCPVCAKTAAVDMVEVRPSSPRCSNARVPRPRPPRSTSDPRSWPSSDLKPSGKSTRSADAPTGGAEAPPGS